MSFGKFPDCKKLKQNVLEMKNRLEVDKDIKNSNRHHFIKIGKNRRHFITIKIDSNRLPIFIKCLLQFPVFTVSFFSYNFRKMLQNCLLQLQLL